MSIFVSLFTGIALSMDCLAVSSCYGIQMPNNRRLMIELGLWFGLFQMIMIFIGSFLGELIVSIIYQYAKIISALLLSGIAIKMFIEGIRDEEHCYENDRMRIIYLAFATSVDALLVGLAYSMLKDNIIFTAIIVGIVCFIFTISGFLIGKLLHRFVGRFAEFIGSAILMGIAIKALFY